MSNSRRESHFLRSVAKALGVCQIVEEILKIYISTSFCRIKDALNGRIPFRFSGTDYDQAAMDKLLQVFRRLSDHDALVKRLTAFKKQRDFVAHRAIMEYAKHGPRSAKDHREMSKRLDEVEREGNVLLQELIVELRRIQAALPPALVDPYADSGRIIH